MNDIFYRCRATTFYEVAALLDKRDDSHVEANEVLKALADVSGREALIHEDAQALLGVNLETEDEYDLCHHCDGTGQMWVGERELLPARSVVKRLRLLAQQAELAEALGFTEVTS